VKVCNRTCPDAFEPRSPKRSRDRPKSTPLERAVGLVGRATLRLYTTRLHALPGIKHDEINKAQRGGPLEISGPPLRRRGTILIPPGALGAHPEVVIDKDHDSSHHPGCHAPRVSAGRALPRGGIWNPPAETVARVPSPL
jgi:hypothetical protein